ncbi:MAG: cellobiose phosphorylase [Chloroflexota bacterium]|nr:MAG: cellobiose phosphorylase [Chloroflexota bacterium]
MSGFYFDGQGRFVLEDFADLKPFSSFLPGIAGPLGIPMWVFYVNRGQAIAAFGVEDKNSPLVEYQPANKAYQLTPYTGFRTFVKLLDPAGARIYEPFSPHTDTGQCARRMHIGYNELELVETCSDLGLEIRVVYFTLPGEDFAALVRQVTFRNLGDHTRKLEVVDGLPVVIPFGVNNAVVKDMSRTLEAWMEVFNLERGIPYYRLRSSVSDTAEVEKVLAGNFYLAFAQKGAQSGLLPAIVDPAFVFGSDTSLAVPRRFAEETLDTLLTHKQITLGKTPCGFSAASFELGPGAEYSLCALAGHASRIEAIHASSERLMQPGAIAEKRSQAASLARELTDAIDCQTASPLFDAYCRQSFLDNGLRGGWPVRLGDEPPFVFHLYSRKHGDLERDYNAFFLAAEFYAQGNGNYRDINQNRRSDVWFYPYVDDFDVLTFVNLLQADGYNPLVIQGSRFSLSLERIEALLGEAGSPAGLRDLLEKPFTPGGLLKSIAHRQIKLTISPQELIDKALRGAEQHVEAVFGEGYWTDHWTYNLDLVEAYLAIYPDRAGELLFGASRFTFFDSPAVVRPRSEKYVLANGEPRQLNALYEDPEKMALIASRRTNPNLVRSGSGKGDVFQTNLFVKLLTLAVNKFASLDPAGMGVEMEAGKPGWCDAMNGLPGLFGSGMAETYELQRLLLFLLDAAQRQGERQVRLPVEVSCFLDDVVALVEKYPGPHGDRGEFDYWDAVSTAREAYRQSTRLGFDGRTQPLRLDRLAGWLQSLIAKVQAGIEKANDLGSGIPPTYFRYQVEDYEILRDDQGNELKDPHGRSRIRARRFAPVCLPPFLEGPVRLMKIQPGPEAARRLYNAIRASDLFDQKLKMYRLNASLESQPIDIGRARAFPPGWLENESIWLHMEYKYLLGVLQAGLYREFFADFKNTLVPFMDPRIYGRSPLENSSFIASSAHPDESLHGTGFVARMSGSTAELLSIWSHMTAGAQPFYVKDGSLCLELQPAIPGWLFREDGSLSFTFLGQCRVTLHNPARTDIFPGCSLTPTRVSLQTVEGQASDFSGSVIPAPFAALVREGRVKSLDIFYSPGRSSP